MAITDRVSHARALKLCRQSNAPASERAQLMIKKNLTEQEEKAAEYTTGSIVRAARLRRESKTGAMRPPSKRRTHSRTKRKNAVVGGMHLRGDKRTLR